MDDAEFKRRAKKYAKSNGLDYAFDPKHGKGSHGRLTVGVNFTTVQKGELRAGMLAAMLRQLGVDKKDF